MENLTTLQMFAELLLNPEKKFVCCQHGGCFAYIKNFYHGYDEFAPDGYIYNDVIVFDMMDDDDEREITPFAVNGTTKNLTWREIYE